MNLARPTAAEIRNAFANAGQAHVFRWWDELDDAGRERLLGQLRRVDLDQLVRLRDDVRRGRLAPSKEGAPSLPEYVPLPQTEQDRRVRAEAAAGGAALIAAGKVAALTVAGGQGTRLGYDAPKGTYPVGPVSRKTLFEIHAEKIFALQKRHGGVIPWYLMTSETNDADTRAYFEDNDWLGLNPDNIRFFTQRMIPVVDHDFKLVMIARDEILTSPNGHGGTLLALFETGMLDDMEARGVEEISYFQVDNVLVPAADPVFLGLHRGARAQMSNKAVWKRDPAEPIGAFVRVSGDLVVIEYSDLSPEEMRRVNETGKLVYGLGSPAIHALRVDFVREETAGGFRLPFHLARKSAEYMDETGRRVRPEGKNVYKFETFIFDALRDARESVILEVRREEEFSPLKNATGEDSPDTCRRDMTALYARWLENAGVRVPREPDGTPSFPIEISPLYALDAEELSAKKLPKDIALSGPLYLGPESGSRR